MAFLVRLINFQGGQALQVFQKAVAQCGVLAPVAGQQLFGKGLHQRNGHRDQRHADQQHHRRRKADGGQHAEQGQRGQQAVKELGQIRAEVAFQLLGALHRHLYHLGGGDPAGIARPQPQKLFQNGAAQRLLGAAAGPVGADRRLPCADKADRRGGSRHQQGGRQRGGLPGHQPGKIPGDGEQHGDVRRQRRPLERHVFCNVLFGIADHPDQPFVNHQGSVSSW